MGSDLRHICAVLFSIAVAAVLATNIALCQISSPDIRTGVYRGQVVTLCEIIDGLWDGDIILGTPEELDAPVFAAPNKALDTHTKALVSSIEIENEDWPGGIVPYVIDPELSNPDRVLEAIQHWEQNTPIRLVERTDQPNWVRFMPSERSRCAAVRVSGTENGRRTFVRHYIFLSERCSRSLDVVIHEIGHTVGLWHEHQRNDRNTYVLVRDDPFDPYRFAYKQQGASALDSGPYDYGSIMHYPCWPEKW